MEWDERMNSGVTVRCGGGDGTVEKVAGWREERWSEEEEWPARWKEWRVAGEVEGVESGRWLSHTAAG